MGVRGGYVSQVRVFRRGFSVGFAAVIATTAALATLAGPPTRLLATSDVTPSPAVSTTPISRTPAGDPEERDPSTFGRLLSDGTLCGVGVGCPEEDPCLKQEQP